MSYADREKLAAYQKQYRIKWVARNPDYQREYQRKQYGLIKSQVYIIQNTETGRFKFGKGKAKSRLAAMQTGNDCLLALLHIWQLPSEDAAFEAERRVKQDFDEFRVRGEWFSASCLDSIRQATQDFVDSQWITESPSPPSPPG